MPFQDQTLTCADCGQPFTFTAGEQEFFQERGFSNPPKRCEDCRSKRKAEHGGGAKAPGGGHRKFGGSGGGGGARVERPKFPAVCTRCGARFDAPFEPKEGRPVFCRECFNAARSSR